MRREIEDVPQLIDRDGIEDWLRKHDNPTTKIEYSTDGGFSFVPLRRKFIEEDSGRIYTMRKMGYQVRSIEITDMSIAGAISSGGSQTRPPVKTIDTVSYIYRDQTEYKWTSTPRPDQISVVTQHVPLSMSMRNQNEYVSRLSDPISQGHIYLITLINSESQLDKLEASIIEEKTGKKVTDFASVFAPRCFDEDTENLLLQNYACNVISHKYFVSTKENKFKIGPRFFIYKAAVPTFANTVNTYGGAAYVGYSEAQLKLPDKNLKEVIVEQEKKLREAIQSGDLETLSNGIFEAIQFRDQAVDALSAFNATIKEARQQAIQMVASEKGTNS